MTAQDQQTRPPRVYIAGPYTAGDPAVNVRNAVQAAERVIEAGGVPYVPHLTHLWHLISPHEYHYWLDLDIQWLRTCDALLRLPNESRGADTEVAEAQRLGLPVFYAFEGEQRLYRWLRDAVLDRQDWTARQLARQLISLRTTVGTVYERLGRWLAEPDSPDTIELVRLASILEQALEPAERTAQP